MISSSSDPTAPPAPALLARQPIFDRDTDIVAYELLYRERYRDSAEVIDGDNTT